MAAILTTITGQDILNNVGSQLSYVGRFLAADIDQNVTEQTPYSEPEIAVEWMQGLFTAAGEDSANTTSEKAAWGNRAMLWRCWLYYFDLSRQGEDCPPECKDPERFWELYNRAKKRICENLALLGFEDPTGNWCKSETANNSAAGLSIMSFSTKFHNTPK
jgi:hypothetical protein